MGVIGIALQWGVGADAAGTERLATNALERSVGGSLGRVRGAFAFEWRSGPVLRGFACRRAAALGPGSDLGASWDERVAALDALGFRVGSESRGFRLSFGSSVPKV